MNDLKPHLEVEFVENVRLATMLLSQIVLMLLNFSSAKLFGFTRLFSTKELSCDED